MFEKLYDRLKTDPTSEDISEDELEDISEDDLEKFDQLLHTFGQNVEDLKRLIDKQPIRVAQRLLRLYGDQAENQVLKIFPDVVDRDKLIFNLRQQQKRYAGQQWSKWGVVRKY